MKTTAETNPLPRGSETMHRFSRFFGQDAFMVGQRKFWGTWEPIVIPNSPSDRYITITEAMAGRIDLVSYEFYGTPELWWIIAEANGIAFPPDDLAVGDVLRIPSPSTAATLGLIR